MWGPGRYSCSTWNMFSAAVKREEWEEEEVCRGRVNTAAALRCFSTHRNLGMEKRKSRTKKKEEEAPPHVWLLLAYCGLYVWNDYILGYRGRLVVLGPAQRATAYVRSDRQLNWLYAELLHVARRRLWSVTS